MTAKLITVGGKEVQALDEKGQPIETAAYDKLTGEQKLSARERGIRAQAKGEASKEAVARVLKQLGVTSFEQLTEVQHLRAQLKQSISPEEERKHGKHQRASGRFEGVLIGLIAGVVLCYIVLPVITTAVSGMLHEAMITGAMVSSQQEHVQPVPRTP